MPCRHTRHLQSGVRIPWPTRAHPTSYARKPRVKVTNVSGSRRFGTSSFGRPACRNRKLPNIVGGDNVQVNGPPPAFMPTTSCENSQSANPQPPNKHSDENPRATAGQTPAPNPSMPLDVPPLKTTLIGHCQALFRKNPGRLPVIES